MVEELTQEQLDQLKDIFFLYDKDKDGKLDPKELPIMMRFIGLILSNADINDIVAQIPKDNRGLVDLPDFLAMMAPRIQTLSANIEQQVIDAFKVLDENKTGFITPGYLYEVMTSFGERLDPEEAQAMIDAARSRKLITLAILEVPKKKPDKEKEKIKEKSKEEIKPTGFRKIYKRKIVKTTRDDGEEEEEEIIEEIEEEIPEEEELEEEEEEFEEEQEEEEVKEPEEVIPYELFVKTLNRDEKKKGKGKGKGKDKGKKK